MTSYEFEKMAKNAAIKSAEKYDRGLTIEDMHIVWFAHVLGNKKCLMFTEKLEGLYFEVTYNSLKEEIYVDTYGKLNNMRIGHEDPLWAFMS